MSNRGLVSLNSRNKYLCNYYEVRINNDKIFSYQFAVEDMAPEETAKKGGEIFKSCVQRIKEIFENKFLFQH